MNRKRRVCGWAAGLVFLLSQSSFAESFTDLEELLPQIFHSGWFCKTEWGGTNPDFSNGFYCRGRLRTTAYPKEVVLFVPAGFEYPARVNSNLFVHLHGYLRNFTTVPGAANFETGVMARFNFIDFMRQAERTDSIVVLPRSAGDNTDYKNYFTGPTRFGEFLQGVTRALSQVGLSASERLGAVSLSVHSGAGFIVQRVLSSSSMESFNQKIVDLVYLDATYSGVDEARISRWALRQPIPPRLRIVYRGGTNTETEANHFKTAFGISETFIEGRSPMPVRNYLEHYEWGSIQTVTGQLRKHWDLINEFLPEIWRTAR